MQGSPIFMGIFHQITVVGWCLMAVVLFRFMMWQTWRQLDRTTCFLWASVGATVALQPLWITAEYLNCSGY